MVALIGRVVMAVFLPHLLVPLAIPLVFPIPLALVRHGRVEVVVDVDVVRRRLVVLGLWVEFWKKIHITQPIVDRFALNL